MNTNNNKIKIATKYLKDNLKISSNDTIDIAIVLGSGLSYLDKECENRLEIKTSDIPNYPKSTVEGHRGVIVKGELFGKTVLYLSGRVHFYEGYTLEEVVFPIEIISNLGIKKVILTNAAGGINKDFKPGDLMLITDHINNISINPLDISNIEQKKNNNSIYSDNLNKIIINSAKTTNLDLKKGVYAAVTGPSFETPAEIRYLDKIGADAVGMSTAPEVIRANKLSMEVSAISCITNYASGVTENKLSHQEVFETAEGVKFIFGKLITEIIKNI